MTPEPVQHGDSGKPGSAPGFRQAGSGLAEDSAASAGVHGRAKASVGVIGGGLAGLAAACALSAAGYKVTLFERRPYLGGRASSYVHPGTGEVVDNCQHVLLGCCTNLLDLYHRLGVGERIRWYDRLTYIEPGGRRGILEPSSLPAPLHALPAFFRFPLLALRDKLSIALGMLSLIEGIPSDDGGSFLQWLKRHGQSKRALNRFWSPVLVSALNAELSDVSIHYGAMVFRDAFLKSVQAGRMGLPSVPLSELYGVAADYIRQRGGEVVLRATIECLGATERRAWVNVRRAQSTSNSSPFKGGATDSRAPQDAGPRELKSNDAAASADNDVDPAVGSLQGDRREFDYLISAIPFQALAKLMPPNFSERAGRLPGAAATMTESETLAAARVGVASDALREDLAQLRTSPITGIHLWFDREVTELEHAVLLDRTIQWMFQKSKILDRQARVADGTAGSYLELVVSSSEALVERSRQEVLELALKELAEFFPAVKAARLLKATVIKEIHATFAPKPGVDRYRPRQQGPWQRIFLSGDWTATGWPATMEGAVRAGYAAAEALTATEGEGQTFLVPDLPAQGWMRLFERKRDGSP